MKKFMFGFLVLFLLVGSFGVVCGENTCFDTDGLNLYNKGIISGYEDENYGEF